MSERKPIFFTSDWHVGHKNIIQLSSRPFSSLDQMHRVLINNYNSTVPGDGVCYFLGDIGLCSTEVLAGVIKKLHGTKVCILGNHDPGINKMYGVGFDVVLRGATLEIGGQLVTATHCPLFGIPRENLDGINHTSGDNWHGESRPGSARYSTYHRGQFHLHGHIHSPNGGRSVRELGRQFDVGVDANDYRPVSISAIESWIARTLEGEK